ncbi:XRE family transcriptional regulator [Streptomyces sp. JNUCC 64]
MDPLALEQIDADIARLARRLVSQPVTTLFPEISTLRHTVFTLLQGRQRPGETRRLYLAAGRLCGLAAHVALDLGQFAVATTHTRTAWQCAESADDNALRSWVRSVQSLLAYWQQDHDRAADFAWSGLQHARAGTVRARLLSLSARADAARGHRPEALWAIEAAKDARQGHTDPPELPGVFAFPEAKQWTYAGTTLLTVGGRRRTRDAVEASTRAIVAYRTAPEEDRSSGDLLAARLDLATAHLAHGDLDAAGDELAVVLDARPERRTASISRRLRAFGALLDGPAHTGSTAARSLRDSVEAAARRSLPTDHPESVQ